MKITASLFTLAGFGKVVFFKQVGRFFAVRVLIKYNLDKLKRTKCCLIFEWETSEASEPRLIAFRIFYVLRLFCVWPFSLANILFFKLLVLFFKTFVILLNTYSLIAFRIFYVLGLFCVWPFTLANILFFKLLVLFLKLKRTKCCLILEWETSEASCLNSEVKII